MGGLADNSNPGPGKGGPKASSPAGGAQAAGGRAPGTGDKGGAFSGGSEGGTHLQWGGPAQTVGTVAGSLLGPFGAGSIGGGVGALIDEMAGLSPNKIPDLSPSKYSGSATRTARPSSSRPSMGKTYDAAVRGKPRGSLIGREYGT